MRVLTVSDFARATIAALHLDKYQRLGLLPRESYSDLMKLQQEGWKIYRNSRGKTKVFSPECEEMMVENGVITVHNSPEKMHF